MPKRYPPEFKRDVVAVARRGDLSVAEIAVDFDIAPESVRRWARQADVGDGIVTGQTTTEQTEVVQLRRRMRRLEMENEILRRGGRLLRAGVAPKIELPAVRDPGRREDPGAADLRGARLQRSGLEVSDRLCKGRVGLTGT